MANVNLKKIPKVTLTKNQVVCLTKDGGEDSEVLHKVYFGANWSAIRHYRTENYTPGFIGRLLGRKSEVREVTDFIEDVDLDATVLIYDKNYYLIDTVYYGHLSSICGAIRHSGDDLKGDQNGDDGMDNETISINLDMINPKAKYLVTVLNSYRHHKFDEIPHIGLRIYTGRLGKPDEVLAAYRLDNNPEFNDKEAIVLGYFYKSDGSSRWKFKADGTVTKERSIKDISKGSAISAIKGGQHGK